jgi:hypothetical protein
MHPFARNISIAASGIVLGAGGWGLGHTLGEETTLKHAERTKATDCLQALGRLPISHEMPQTCASLGIVYRVPPLHDEFFDVVNHPELPSVEVVRSELYNELADPREEQYLSEEACMWLGLGLGLLSVLNIRRSDKPRNKHPQKAEQ